MAGRHAADPKPHKCKYKSNGCTYESASKMMLALHEKNCDKKG